MSFLGTTPQEPTASSASYLESSFDYRSLLPTSRPAGLSAESESADESCLPSLSWKERYLGCACCMVAGYLLSMGSFWRLGSLLTGNPLPFVLNATVGNVIALAGSCFLMGPTAQMDRMWKEQRRTATMLYLGSLILTLIVAFWKGLFLQSFWLILLMIVQFCSITWYCLSYIPYAQDAVTGYCSRLMQRTEY